MEELGLTSAGGRREVGFWNGRNVFLTGHTGFKGGWLSHWLSDLGAKVFGYALQPSSSPNFFDVTKLSEKILRSTIGDVCDLESLTAAIREAQPSVVIHLAAQPLVRESYSDPVGTFSTNLMGTVHLLEAVRHVESVRAVVVVTTDKCYENQEWIWPYRESDRLGGHDPYSSSKACAELASAAYRLSFFSGGGASIATARAGNVIGGGDWGKHRIVPDFLRSSDMREVLLVRAPNSIRPWQHVLEPLSGYLTLAEKLLTNGPEHARAWNFGPDERDAKSVSSVVQMLCERVPGSTWTTEHKSHPHEAELLKLDITNATSCLNWRPRWSLDTALDKTVEWHRAWRENLDMAAFTVCQIRAYEVA